MKEFTAIFRRDEEWANNIFSFVSDSTDKSIKLNRLYEAVKSDSSDSTVSHQFILKEIEDSMHDVSVILGKNIIESMFTFRGGFRLQVNLYNYNSDELCRIGASFTIQGDILHIDFI